ncbi:MAG TPA: replication initiation protein [Gillisia sp.]|nr:replication initiation protein [Gillisia sp.]
MKADSKEVIQGYVLTAAKYDFSRYEKLIMYKMVEIAQDDLKGKKLGPGYSINQTLFNDKILEIPIKDFLPEGDKNHAQVKKALTSLRNKTIEYEDAREWRLIGIIEKPVVEKYSDKVVFEVQPLIWEAILNFSKGHTRYELHAAMEFKSVYAMRFYEMFSKNLKPLTLHIDTLKERFGLSDKYTNRPSDFIKYVVVAAKKELDLKSEFSFNYSIHKDGRQMSSIKFVPYHIPANKNPQREALNLQKRISPRFDLSKELIGFLNDMGFTNDGVKNNLKLFKKANTEIDLYMFLKKISRQAAEAKNPAAYVVGSLKKYLHNKQDDKPVNPKMSKDIDNLLDSFASGKSV